jgi:hypothetical protein
MLFIAFLAYACKKRKEKRIALYIQNGVRCTDIIIIIIIQFKYVFV